MTNWKPGMKAVSLKAMPVYGYKAGHVFTVHGTSECKCGLVLDVGVFTNGRGCKCSRCGHVWHGHIAYGLASLFRPLLGHEQDQLDAIEEEVETEQLVEA
jgi:hypothetical protein